ncbi:MAG: hypothetical protein WHS38_01055 [Thermodesulforhabdaceae bacterium]
MDTQEMVTKLLYEFKITISSRDLESINSFAGEILQKATKLGVDSVSVSINTLTKETTIKKGSELKPLELKQQMPQKRAKRQRARVADGTSEMKVAIQKFFEEKGKSERKELMDFLKERFKDLYKETTITQKADMIIREFLQKGILAKSSRGIFEIATTGGATV